MVEVCGMGKGQRLSVKQERFVNGAVQGKSFRRAALDAGYSLATAKNAHEDIAARPAVQAELVERLGAEGISADWVLQELKRDVDTSSGPNPVRTKSLELLGRATGAFDQGTETKQSEAGLPKEYRDAFFQDILKLVHSDFIHTDSQFYPLFAAYMEKLAALIAVLAEPTRSAMQRVLQQHGALITARAVFERTLMSLGELRLPT